MFKVEMNEDPENVKISLLDSEGYKKFLKDA
jgi:hypothetical protein